MVFIGVHQPVRQMSENTVNKALRLMGYEITTEVCGHGVRAMACSALKWLKWHTEFGHLNRGDMLTSEQHRCSNEKKKFQRRV